jgi:hypothetical protein
MAASSGNHHRRDPVRLRRFKFQKRSHYFISAHNVTLSIVMACVNNPGCPPLTITPLWVWGPAGRGLSGGRIFFILRRTHVVALFVTNIRAKSATAEVEVDTVSTFILEREAFIAANFSLNPKNSYS